jgi:hypothetical protein
MGKDRTLEENMSPGVHLLAMKQPIRKWICLEEETVNPVGVSGRVELGMAQMDRHVHEAGNIEMLMERILSRENLRKALRRVEKNKGSHGVDGMPPVPSPSPWRSESNRSMNSLWDGVITLPSQTLPPLFADWTSG